MAVKGKVTKVKNRKLKNKGKEKVNKHGEPGLGLAKKVVRNDISKDTKTTIWMSHEEHMEFKIQSMRKGVPLYEHLYDLIMLGEKAAAKKAKKEEADE